MTTNPVPPDGRAARRAGRSAAALTALALVLPTALGPGSAAAGTALPPPTGPIAAVPLPSAVEVFSPYLPQVSCDPVVKPGVKAFAALALATWGRGHTASLARPCGVGGESEHKEGRAWDWGLDLANFTDVVAGARAVSWLLANDALNARRVGVMYVIWNKRIWSTYRRAEGWRPYTGGDPHTSHIHISFSWAGAMKRTSWWTGKVAPIEYGPCIAVQGAYAPPYGDTINLSPCPPPKAPTSAGTGTVQATSVEMPGFTPPPAP